MSFGILPDRFQTRGDEWQMDEHFHSARLLARLKKSYSDRGNTLTWALFIWSFAAVGFALFLPFEATLLRSVGVAVCWSAFHLVRGV
jgi:hypothetical protein